MAKPTDKKAIVKQQIKKSVRKLTAVLPLAALLVEEVQAAQGLDDEQLAELALQEELKKKQADALMMPGAADGSVQVAEEEGEEELLAEGEEGGRVQADAQTVVDGADARSGDLLLAMNDVADPAATGTIASDSSSSLQPILSGSGASTNISSLAIDTPFELSGLPAFAAAPAILGGLGLVAVNVAADDGTAATPTPTPDPTPTTDEVVADGTQLGTSLKDLQAAGVDVVNVPAGVSTLSLDMGASGSLNAASMPLFGDANLDGIVSDAEDAALDVTLNINSAAQWAEMAGLGGLSAMAAAGVDNVQFNLADQTALSALLGNTNLAAELLAVKDAGLNVDTINMANNAATVTDTQLQSLADAGISFAANDDVTVTADGTHLNTSLKTLADMGVSTVTGSGDLHVNLGTDTFANINVADFPTFEGNNFNVTLDASNVTQFDQLASAAGSVHSLGVDAIQLNMVGQDELNQLLTLDGPPNVQAELLMAAPSAFDSKIEALRNAQVDINTIDMVSNVASVNEAQLATVADAGLHFASNDLVNVDMSFAHATHLATGTQNSLHNLGVDTVSVTDVAAIQTAEDLSDLAAALNKAGVDHLGLASSAFGTSGSNLGELVSGFDWAHSGIDFVVNVNDDISSTLALLEQGVNIIDETAFDAATAADNYGELITTLQAAGLGGIEVETPDHNVVVSDDLSAALYEAGMLHAVPGANVTITADADSSSLPNAALLETSLKAMAELGVDAVETVDAVDKVYVELGANADVADIIRGFTAPGSEVAENGLFAGKEAGLVMDQATFTSLTQGDVTELLNQLSQLGFTEIDVLGSTGGQSYDINVAATKPPVLSTPVALGEDETTAMHDVFGTDINHKPIG